jgi:tRNA splicing endonuclease
VYVEEMHREKLELSLSSIRRRAESVKKTMRVCVIYPKVNMLPRLKVIWIENLAV